MNGILRRAVVACAAVGLVVGVSALPASAGFPDPVVEVTGVATCDPATGAYMIDWTVSNDTPVHSQPDAATPAALSPDQITTTAAVQSGAATGSVPDLVGVTLLSGDDVSGMAGPVANTTGTVTLTVTYSLDFFEEPGFTAEGTVELDGSCVPPTTPTTAAPTTMAPAPAAAAVTAAPAFTG